MKEFWDHRYARDMYAYGKLPNIFFKQCLDSIMVPGTILLPAEGEGRNAVYAAAQGWKVTCFDISIEGRKKALELGEEHQVEFDYRIGDFQESKLAYEQFDCIALIYAHMNKSDHGSLQSMLASKGHIILEGFSEGHMEYQAANPTVGGPKKQELLFTKASIEKDFEGMKIIDSCKIEVDLDEGDRHVGKSSIIRYFGKKP